MQFSVAKMPCCALHRLLAFYCFFPIPAVVNVPKCTMGHEAFGHRTDKPRHGKRKEKGRKEENVIS